MDRLQAMSVFIQVVESHGFSKAAEVLGLPKSTVSRVIKETERYLGVKLLQRTTRQVSITDEGEAYLEYCRRILTEVEVMENSFNTSNEKPSGRLVVGMPTSLANHFILPRISDFIREYPNIRLIIRTSDRLVDLIEEGYDCVIRAGEIHDSTTLVARHVRSFSWVIVASPCYIAKYGKPENLASLAQHYSVGYLNHLSGRTTDWRFKESELSYPMKSMLTVDNTDTYINSGLQGLGLIRIASYLAESYIKNGLLVPVLESYESPELHLSLVFPQNKYKSSSLSVFSEWVKAVLQEAIPE